MSVLKYKDPVTGEWLPASVLKIVSTGEPGGSSSVVGIPDDIVAEAERVASSINSKQATNSINFIVMADMHEMGDSDHSDATIIKRYRKANLNAGQGAKIVAEKIRPDFFANLGDLAWGSSSTSLHDWAQSVSAARGYTAGMGPLTECFFTPGNHDSGYPNGDYDENLVVGLIGNYRYVDFAAKKVRVICLNTADNTDGTNGCERISGEQLQWFANALDLSGKSDAAKWGILILSHHPLDYGSIKPAANCLAAYVNGTNYSTTYDGMSISKDFTGKNLATVVANFHGHLHSLYVTDISGTTVKRIAVPNACFGRNNEYGTEATTYNKVDNGTGKNTAFNAVSIDLTKKIIYADCFGAGYDRIISYGEADVTTYSVTNNLSNASTSNGTATIMEGAAYVTTVTANSGYELTSVKVTMGGVDITASAVNGGTISIPNVTGNIVVTVTTTQIIVPPSYDNLVLKSTDANGNLYNGTGYQEGYRLNSSGTTTEEAGCVNSGFIPYNGEVIRVWGTASHNADNAGNYVAMYDADFNKIYVVAMGNLSKEGGTWISKDSKYMLILDPETITNENYKSNLLSAKYIRASMVNCAGADFVVTLDEPIE